MKQLIVNILVHFKSPVVWLGLIIAAVGVVITTLELGYHATAGIIIICTGTAIANNNNNNTT